MAVSKIRETQRHVTYEIDADGSTPVIRLDPHFEASYQLVRAGGADGTVSVQVTNDLEKNDLHEIASEAGEVHAELPPASGLQVTVSGQTTGTHRVHVFRIER